MSEDNALTLLRSILEGRHWAESGIGYDLWILITALRGPDFGPDLDSPGPTPKWETTVRLRKAICSSFFDFGYELSATSAPHRPEFEENDFDFRQRMRKELAPLNTGDHFLTHYIDACLVYWKLEGKN